MCGSWVFQQHAATGPLLPSSPHTYRILAAARRSWRAGRVPRAALHLAALRTRGRTGARAFSCVAPDSLNKLTSMRRRRAARGATLRTPKSNSVQVATPTLKNKKLPARACCAIHEAQTKNNPAAAAARAAVKGAWASHIVGTRRRDTWNPPRYDPFHRCTDARLARSVVMHMKLVS